MGTITTIGLDLAKLVFSACVQDAFGRVRQRKDLRRGVLLQWLTQLPAGTVVAMEACSGANYWARRCLVHGLQPRLIAAQFVSPFRKSQTSKNDRNDAEAIATAARQGNMRFVPIKSEHQRQGWLGIGCAKGTRPKPWPRAIDSVACWPSGKDRTCLLPVRLRGAPQQHLLRVAALHKEDLARGRGYVPLPGALHRKYPDASRSLAWQFVFPSRTQRACPETARWLRWHASESTVQRAFKTALVTAGVLKHACVHFATPSRHTSSPMEATSGRSSCFLAIAA